VDEPTSIAILNEVLFRYNFNSVQEFDKIATARFAHYTSADTAMSILMGENGPDGPKHFLWLRNATEMNDFSEIEHGQKCLSWALSNEGGKLWGPLKDAVETIAPGGWPEIFEVLNREAPAIKANTFLLSLSMHEGIECRRGKLSMWRAYGGHANVCFIFKPDVFFSDQRAYEGINLSRVLYTEEVGFAAEIDGIISRIKKQTSLLSAMDRDLFLSNLKRALDFAVLATKHPGFEEETEWRLIYRPPAEGGDFACSIVSVGGVVQPVYKIPLKNEPEKGLHNATIPELVQRIIIGPTANPAIVRKGFVSLLRGHGVEDAEDRVVSCGIPLRR
jgi:hypothetical protein